MISTSANLVNSKVSFRFKSQPTICGAISSGYYTEDKNTSGFPIQQDVEGQSRS